jgi:phosphoglycolate phosphatase
MGLRKVMHVKLDRVRAVAFDLDGTLIDTLPDLSGAVNATLTALGMRELTQERVKQLIGDGADKLVARAVAEALTGKAEPDSPAEGALVARQAEAMELFFDYYAQHLFSRSRVYPEAARTLRTLADNGVAVCCVTNKSSRFALPLLELTGLSALLRFTLCADRVQDRKPSPVLLLEACRRFDVTPPEMLYVGDSHTDVLAAHNAGCGAVAVTFGYHKPGSLERVKPEAMVSGLMQIALDLLDLPPNPTGPAAHIQEVPT